jgi:hypothetical protein
MTAETIKQILFGGGGLLLILMTLIQITPIKINPWSRLGRCIGRALNGEVLREIKDVKSDISETKNDLNILRQECNERDATLSRTHILRFGDEILHGVPHSKEHYEQILIDVDSYEEYCNNHPEYRNNVAVATIKHIKKMYQKHLEEDSFL